MQCTPLLLSLPGPPWPAKVAHDSHINGSIRTKLCDYANLNDLKLTVFFI